MPEYVTYDDRKQLVRVMSVGETSIQEWKKSAFIISNLIQEFNSRSVLIDVRCQMKGPDYRSVFNFGVDLLRLKNFMGVKFAILVNGFSDIHDLLMRTTTFRGLNFKIFENEEVAIYWLKHETLK
jgi:hypothetical protein